MEVDMYLMKRLSPYLTVVSIIFSIPLLCIGAGSVDNVDISYIHFENGDKISGKIITENDKTVVIESNTLGTISLDRTHIASIISASKPPEESTEKAGTAKLWDNKISLGYSQSGGNTTKSSFSGSLLFHRKTIDDEFHLRATGSYGSSNKKMDSQKWDGLVRYAYSFYGKKLYYFYKFEIDHDYFANIDYRLVPSTGIGCWLSDKPDWKFLTELGLGFQNTNYRDDTSATNQMAAIPRLFLEKKLTDRIRFVQDLLLYSSLDYVGEYRLHSETSLINPLNDIFSVRLGFTYDYNSDPASSTTKKEDFQFITAIDCAF
jgi:putative salt-induced outer membrane protein YdiY